MILYLPAHIAEMQLAFLLCNKTKVTSRRKVFSGAHGLEGYESVAIAMGSIREVSVLLEQQPSTHLRPQAGSRLI